MTLISLLQRGETLTVEFKSDRDPLSDADLIASVVCIANWNGGTILVGVEDDGTVTGLHPKHQTRPELLAAMIANKTVPPVIADVTFEPIASHLVAIIKIPKSRTPVATSDGKMTIRFQDVHGNPDCRPFYPYEMVGWHGDRGLNDMTAQPLTGASWDDFDPLEFHRLRTMVETYHGDQTLLSLKDKEIARALGLVIALEDRLVPTLAGLLLLGRESVLREVVPTHEVAFQVLHQSNVAVNDFFRGPLLRVVERVYELFQIRNEEQELTVGPFRVPIPTYDFRAYREAVNNAMMHRDYSRFGAVHVQLHDDRLVVSNPGGFVNGVRPNNLLVVGPVPRNPRLSDCFKRIGLVERTGRGVSIIYKGQLRNGRLAPSYQDFQEKVKVTLHGSPTDLKLVQIILNEERRRQQVLTMGELLILERVYRERDITIETSVKLTQESEVDVRGMLQSLVESGLLERHGSGDNREYHFSAAVYREFGIPEAYVYTHGFEPIQREQMVIQYVKHHGKITTNETMKLCRIELRTARRLLKKLQVQGIIQKQNQTRNAYYVATNKP